MRRPRISTLFPTRRSSDLNSAASSGSRRIPGFGDHQQRTEPERASSPLRLCSFRSSGGLKPPSLTTNNFWKTVNRSEEHTSELQSLTNIVCRLLLETKIRK